ncbi:histone deacetylase [bacterium]|nr:histone deacetylase [bacterium]
MTVPTPNSSRIYRADRFYDHRTGQHPECPQRLAAIDDRLEQGIPAGWESCAPSDEHASSEAVREAIRRLHTEEYLQQLSAFAAHGGGKWDADTVVSGESYDVALLAASTAVEAVKAILQGECQHAFCVTRPPGHHAVAGSAMGFCLLNNAAIAAQYAIDHFKLNRVLIVDWDVHHGNGTQDLFYGNGEVWYFSSHRHPYYPGTGLAEETGEGAGVGANCNFPFSINTPRETILDRFEEALADFAARCQPELIVVSAGFDAHQNDPIGSLGLTTEDFGRWTVFVKKLAEKYAQGRILSVLEGGYSPEILAECVLLHLQKLRAE